MANPFFDDVAGPAAALTRADGLDWFDRQTPDRQKVLSPFMIARMMCGTNDPVHLIRMNTVFNPYHFGDAAAGVHAPDKTALFKLLHVAANHGRKVSYSWIKGPTGKAKSNSLKVVCEYYDISAREASSYKVDAESLVEMAEELGWDKEEIAKLTKEQDGPRDTKAASRKPAKRR